MAVRKFPFSIIPFRNESLQVIISFKGIFNEFEPLIIWRDFRTWKDQDMKGFTLDVNPITEESLQKWICQLLVWRDFIKRDSNIKGFYFREIISKVFTLDVNTFKMNPYSLGYSIEGNFYFWKCKVIQIIRDFFRWDDL